MVFSLIILSNDYFSGIELSIFNFIGQKIFSSLSKYEIQNYFLKNGFTHLLQFPVA